MKRFVVNRYGRLVFPFNFFPSIGNTSGAFVAWGEVGITISRPGGTIGPARPFVSGFTGGLTGGGLFSMLADDPALLTPALS